MWSDASDSQGQGLHLSLDAAGNVVVRLPTWTTSADMPAISVPAHPDLFGPLAEIS